MKERQRRRARKKEEESNKEKENNIKSSYGAFQQNSQEFYGSSSGIRRDNSHNSNLTNKVVNVLHMKRGFSMYTHT